MKSWHAWHFLQWDLDFALRLRVTYRDQISHQVYHYELSWQVRFFFKYLNSLEASQKGTMVDFATYAQNTWGNSKWLRADPETEMFTFFRFLMLLNLNFSFHNFFFFFLHSIFLYVILSDYLIIATNSTVLWKRPFLPCILPMKNI